MENKKKEDSDLGFVLTGICVTIIIFCLWGLTYILLKDMPIADRGTIGDMFETINALFSGLALAGIILTILLQRKELKLQRTELSDTRKEFETQNTTLKIQRFENTFFSLLNLHHQIVGAINLKYYKYKEKSGRSMILQRMDSKEDLEAVDISGRDVFKYRYNKMNYELYKNEKEFEKIYLIHYKEAQTDFGHYFRNLYRMIKLVDETDFFYDQSKVTKKEIFEIKYRYTSIIRAQISDYELLWIFYNCLSENGIEKFKPLIEKYALFKNIPVSLITSESHISMYSKNAFSPTIDI